MVISLTGLSSCSSGSGVPKAGAGCSRQREGAFSLTYDENFLPGAQFLYRCAGDVTACHSNGRTSITIGGFNLVAYLVNLESGFPLRLRCQCFVRDWRTPGGGFVHHSTRRVRMRASRPPRGIRSDCLLRRICRGRRHPHRQYDRRGGYWRPERPNSGVAFNATYSVSSSPTNGRGTMTVTSGPEATPSSIWSLLRKFVAVSLNDPNPAVLDFELSLLPLRPLLFPRSRWIQQAYGRNSSTRYSDVEWGAPIRRGKSNGRRGSRRQFKVPTLRIGIVQRNRTNFEAETI